MDVSIAAWFLRSVFFCLACLSGRCMPGRRIHGGYNNAGEIHGREHNEGVQPTLHGLLSGPASQTSQLVEVNDHLWVSKDIGDSILVTTSEGNVVINTGMIGNGDQHRQRFEKVKQGEVKYIVITQCHGDHFGGAYELSDAGTQIITHENFEKVPRLLA